MRLRLFYDRSKRELAAVREGPMGLMGPPHAGQWTVLATRTKRKVVFTLSARTEAQF